MRETDKTRQDRPNVRLVFAIGQCRLVWSKSRIEPKRGYVVVVVVVAHLVGHYLRSLRYTFSHFFFQKVRYGSIEKILRFLIKM